MVGDRKSVLIVGNDWKTLADYETKFQDGGFDVTPILYGGPQTEVPADEFYAAIVGVDGDWRNVVTKIKSDKILIVSNNDQVIRDVRRSNFIAVEDTDISGSKLVEMLQ